MPTEKLFDAEGHVVKISWGRGHPGFIIGAAESESPDSRGWHVEFNERDAANWIIATMRRARDGAFGKDQ